MVPSGHPRTCEGATRRDYLLWDGVGGRGGGVKNFCSHFIAMTGGPVVAEAKMRGLNVNLTVRKT